MSRAARKLRRATERTIASGLTVLDLAAESLGFSAEQNEEARTREGVYADMLRARFIELAELVHGHTNEEAARLRAELEQRNGAGFLERVAATGEPAATAALRIRYRSGKFATSRRSLYPCGLGGGRCGRSRCKSGGSELRSGSSRSSRIGYGRAATSSRVRGPRSRSFWSGEGVVSESGPFHTVTRTSRSNAPTERSSVRPGREFLPRGARLLRVKEAPAA
jgi:hypothetical protein